MNDAPPPHHDKPVTILIAEDSPTQAERLRYTLERHGYSVTVTTNGRKALEAARASRPTLVISDVIMPEMDGYELCLKIKTDENLSTVPVILVTTLSDANDVIRGLECRADNFIIKPYDEHYLISRIEFCVQNYAMGQRDGTGTSVEIYFNGQRHVITSSRMQILNLLLSTYEAAIQRNQELTRIKDDLRTVNTSLAGANRELEQSIQSERQMHQELKDAQAQLVQAEKLAGLGQMVAGVAHEINNPLSFVLNNTFVLQRDLRSIAQLLELYREHNELIARHDPHAAQRIAQMSEQMDLSYALEHLDQSMEKTKDGIKRIGLIVKDLRDFARLDQGEIQEVDLNAGIRSTMNIVQGRALHKQVRLEFNAGELPPVSCSSAKINQVVMNLISNAVDASKENDTVTITTRFANDEAQIEVADTGVGIDPQVKHRIFDPFFTTKPQGEGVGLGLSISYSIIRDHHGRIELDSTPGKGSRFTIHLPIRGIPQPS